MKSISNLLHQGYRKTKGSSSYNWKLFRVGVGCGVFGASLVSENKVLCHPSSIDTAETCHLQKEDHVSMGAFSARKAVTVADILPGYQLFYEKIRKISPTLERDRYTVPEYKQLREYMASGEMWDTVQQFMQSTSNYGMHFAQADFTFLEFISASMFLRMTWEQELTLELIQILFYKQLVKIESIRRVIKFNLT